jgi:hypothetical protein
MPSDTKGIAEQGRRAVAEELKRRGANIRETRRGNVSLLEVRSPTPRSRRLIRVKTRTSGTWQGSTTDADPAASPTVPETYWVFVDLEHASAPVFFIVPDQWMRRDIHEDHERYLARHGGQRAVAKDSTHHAIEFERIAEWHNRWDLLGL